MSTVWDRTTEFIGDNLGSILPVAGIILVSTAAQDLIGSTDVASQPVLAMAVGGLGLIVALITLQGQLALTALAVDDRRSSGDAIGLSLSRLLGALGLVVALIGIFLVAMLPLVAIMLSAGVMPTPGLSTQALVNSLPQGVRMAVLVYALGLVIAGIWLGVRLALVLPLVVEERLAFGAIGRSFKLTRGLTLRILGVFLLLGIVSFVAGLAAKTVFGSVLRLIFGDNGPWSVGGVLTALLVGAVATLFTIIGTAFSGKLYLAARAREREAQVADE